MNTKRIRPFETWKNQVTIYIVKQIKNRQIDKDEGMALLEKLKTLKASGVGKFLTDMLQVYMKYEVDIPDEILPSDEEVASWTHKGVD